jgi:ribosomal protein S18 acetylase RimI-like enzyme
MAMSENISIERIERFSPGDLNQMCEATMDAIRDDQAGFSTGQKEQKTISKEWLETYWKGTLLVPERLVFVGRVDKVIGASLQIVKPAPSAHTRFFCGTIERHFVAPWARGHTIAKELLIHAEDAAKSQGLSVLNVSVREDLADAIAIYESNGYQKWGTLPCYEIIKGKMHSGYFYYKELG